MPQNVAVKPTLKREKRIHKTIRIRPSILELLNRAVSKEPKRHVAVTLEAAISHYCALISTDKENTG